MGLLDMLFPPQAKVAQGSPMPLNREARPGGYQYMGNPQPQEQSGGILSLLLGADNPAAKWANQNRNWLAATGQGIASGFQAPDWAAASRADQQAAQDKVNATKAEQSKNLTFDFISKNAPDIAAMVQAGLPIAEAWQTYIQRMQPKAAPDPIKLGAGETLFDPMTGQPIFTAPQAPGTAEPPVVQTRYNPETGLEEKVQWDSTSGSWKPFGGQKAVRGANDLSATETKQLFEAEEKIQASQNAIDALNTAMQLSQNANAGFGADIGSQIGANVADWVPIIGGNEQRDNNTLKLKNLITEQALSSLKATFGSAPTEGERQILLEIQGSVTQPKEVRESIWKRALQMAQKRIEFESQRKAKIESGGYGMTTQGSAGGAPVYRGGNFSIVGVE